MKEPKTIEHTREELTQLGFRWIESRKCKRCGVFIEIWSTPAHTRIALDLQPDLGWKLVPHIGYCKGPKPAAKQAEMFDATV